MDNQERDELLREYVKLLGREDEVVCDLAWQDFKDERIDDESGTNLRGQLFNLGTIIQDMQAKGIVIRDIVCHQRPLQMPLWSVLFIGRTKGGVRSGQRVEDVDVAVAAVKSAIIAMKG